MEDRILSYLGLAQRSGNLVSGEETCEISLKKNEVKLVIIASDASSNTKKKFLDMCKFRNIDIFTYSSKEKLSHAIGKVNRAVFGIKDEGFAKKIFEQLVLVSNVSHNLGGE
ncbi:MAG: L7Ae/L30e/S12e/Gadd45 family ribosomal protein [Bacillota bacterium]